jgi:acetyl-CoA/propionyl-CoA carboxylase biotin carboxyl carrier protein
MSAGAFSTELTLRDRETSLGDRLANLSHAHEDASPEVRTPMPGTVVTVDVSDGDTVDAGAPLLTLEAMKMEHRLSAPIAGTVAISIRAGDTVKAGQLVATVTPPQAPPHAPTETTDSPQPPHQG